MGDRRTHLRPLFIRLGVPAQTVFAADRVVALMLAEAEFFERYAAQWQA